MTLRALLVLLLAATASAAPEVEVRSRAAAQGEALLIVARGAAALPTGSLDGKALAFFPARGGDYAALAGVDLEAKPGRQLLAVDLPGADGTAAHWSKELDVRETAFSSETLKVDDKFVRLKPADEARSEKEAAELKRLFAAESPALLARSAFLSPIAGAVSARFGERRVFNGVPKSPHTGADLKAKKGTPVKAPAAGRVVLARSLFYSGNSVVLDHGLGLLTFYGHLSRIRVKVGEIVAPGRVLGLVGATGRVTGPHLHWGARLRGARVDPFSLTALPLDEFLGEDLSLARPKKGTPAR